MALSCDSVEIISGLLKIRTGLWKRIAGGSGAGIKAWYSSGGADHSTRCGTPEVFGVHDMSCAVCKAIFKAQHALKELSIII
jgi:hypothetical protein